MNEPTPTVGGAVEAMPVGLESGENGMPHASDTPAVLLGRLVWARLAALVLLTCVSLLVFWRSGESLLCHGLVVLYCLAAGGAGVSLCEYAVLRLGLGATALVAFHILSDLALATGWLYATGGAGSLFSFLYLVVVIEASVLLDPKGTMFATVVAGALYWLMAHLEFTRVFVPIQGSIHEGLLPSDHYPVSLVLFTLAAMFLTAGLSSYSKEKIKRARRILAQTAEGMEDLKAIHEHIVRCIHSGLVTADRYGRITSFNRAAERITGLGNSEVVGRSIHEVFRFDNPQEADGPEEGVRTQAHAPFRWESSFEDRQGRKMILGFSSSPLLDHRGRPLGRVYVFQDLTAYKQMEEELKRADRMAAIGELAAGLAHEIRNPLASLYGSVEILKSELDLRDTHRRLMEIVVSESERLNGLIGEFLQFANPTTVAKEPISLRELVEETLLLFRNSSQWREDFSVVVDIPPELTLYGNRSQMGQVLWNLLLNAVQAMPEGGRIHIQGRQIRASLGPDEGSAPARKAEISAVEWTVSDTGVGIPKEDVGKIFDPFFTTKPEGSGLGLAVVYRIVEKHGGKISVESEVGRGTTFRILVPTGGRRGARSTEQA